ISNRKWFSLICDETCDESTLEQLCVGIRSVNDNYEVFEDVLDLAVHDLTNECPTISNCILFAKDIIGFVRRSPKCLAVLKEISSQLSMPYSNLTSLCPTRWTMRAESYNSLLNNYELGIQNLNYVYLFILLLIFLAWCERK
ncbi:unnamed protein product, partial [Rotaria magnacalcarata]